MKAPKVFFCLVYFGLNERNLGFSYNNMNRTSYWTCQLSSYYKFSQMSSDYGAKGRR